MTNHQLRHFIATDPQGILRVNESKLSYFVKRMWYKVLLTVKPVKIN